MVRESDGVKGLELFAGMAKDGGTASRASEIARRDENCEGSDQPDGDAAENRQPVINLVDEQTAGAEEGKIGGDGCRVSTPTRSRP